MNINASDCKHQWYPVRWAIKDKNRYVEQLMCQKCCILINFQDVVDSNHRLAALSDLQLTMTKLNPKLDWDTVRIQFLQLLDEGCTIPDAHHQIKMCYKLYPPAPPAQDIQGEEVAAPLQ